MKILHVAPSFHPATYYGGPIFTTHALCNALVELPGVELRVLTSDKAGPKLSDRVPAPKAPVRFPAGYDVHYTRRLVPPDIAPALLARLWGRIGWADVVLLTGAYSSPTIPTLLVCRLRDKPLLWSPHGALKASHEWGGVRRPALKRAWEAACRQLKPRRCMLHVTTEMERSASEARMPGFPTVVIPNAVELPQELPQRTWCPVGKLRLLYLGRIDPIKGLDLLLRALPHIESATLDICGSGDPDFVGSLKRLATDLAIEGRVHFHGHVDGEEKRNAFLNADIFVLPTHSENFGLAVAEALGQGVPAIVSRGAPWAELETRGCGRWVPNTPEKIAQAIESLRDADLASMGARGRAWMQADFGWAGIATKMLGVCAQLSESEPIAELRALSR